jgi:beta-fructofuranosidase
VAGDVFSVALITDNPPLDDFWGMLTGIETPKLVDGPELVKHGAVRIRNRHLRLVLHDDIVEFFVDGKVITYRLLARESDGNKKASPVGLFVEDGSVEFKGLTFSKTE